MKEIAEFRVVEEYASKLFLDSEGEKLGDSIRKIELATDDPHFEQIGELQKEIDINLGRSFFHGWDIHRHYTKDELALAICFQLNISTIFEPAGEECGTKYDESKACPECGAGATQVSDLRLDLRKAPKKKHIACTIADELIISQWLAERMTDANFTGFELRPVRHKARYEDDPLDLRQVPTGREILKKAQLAGVLDEAGASAPHPMWNFDVWLNREENRKILEQAQAEYTKLKGEIDRRSRKPMPTWYQLVVISSDAEIVPPTRMGINPFDEDSKGEYRCQRGDLIGLNLLSEVFISKASFHNSDFISSRQFIGTRRGLLRPRRIILIAPRMQRLIISEKLRGVKLEIAHVI